MIQWVLHLKTTAPATIGLASSYRCKVALADVFSGTQVDYMVVVFILVLIMHVAADSVAILAVEQTVQVVIRIDRIITTHSLSLSSCAISSIRMGQPDTGFGTSHSALIATILTVVCGALHKVVLARGLILELRPEDVQARQHPKVIAH